MIRLLKKAMQFVCLALMLVVLMAVVSVADGDMPLLNGVILFISCLLGVNLQVSEHRAEWPCVQSARR